MQILHDVLTFLDSIAEEDSAKIYAHLKLLEENYTEGLNVKQLKGKIREIIVKQYRIIFFRKTNIIYIVDAFKKQTQKTPKRIIERAEKMYKIIEQ